MQFLSCSTLKETNAMQNKCKPSLQVGPRMNDLSLILIFFQYFTKYINLSIIILHFSDLYFRDFQ